LFDAVLKLTDMVNGEDGVKLHSIIVHETQTGYAQCFREDIENPRMGMIDLNAIEFSLAIVQEWRDHNIFNRIKRGERCSNSLVKV
jgi:6-pyruvoyltetrahydropterin/6-carboxytetrahydropterin synthase